MPQKINGATALQKFHTFNLVIGKQMNGTGGEHQLERRCFRTVKVKQEMMAFAGEHPPHAGGAPYGKHLQREWPLTTIPVPPDAPFELKSANIHSPLDKTLR